MPRHPPPVCANRVGHSAGRLSPDGPSRNAQALLLLQVGLERALMQNGLLDFSDHKRKTVRDVLFIEDGWDARFERWRGPKWPRARMSGVPGGLELVAAFHQFAAAMLSSMLVQGVHAKARLV